ncbi:hypothetical protein DY000_02056894 [Brassica cretica]|uniref:F-box associated domain-containing protein n=1 Tax=Brassica cretica TaxID=69181 RepID=A0ABQ7ACK7_BRACR|nr:hypothetical protein DY000_02056894 [Brassica cretica]
MSCSPRLKTSFGNMFDLSVDQIISDPFFRCTYLTKWKRMSKLVGFFICKTKKSGSFKYELRRPPFEFHHSLPLEKYLSPNPNDYYLWNPSTRRRHRIPHHEAHFEFPCTSLIVEDRPFSYKSRESDWWSCLLVYATGGRVAIYDTNSHEKRIGLGRSTKSVMEIWKLGKVNGVFQWKLQHKVNFKVVLGWYDDVKAERFSRSRKEVKKLLAFPVRNESQTCSSSRPATITEMLKGSKEEKKKLSATKKEEEQGVPYGMSAMSCHSFDDIGFPFFFRFIKGAGVSNIIGKKLLRYYMSS